MRFSKCHGPARRQNLPQDRAVDIGRNRAFTGDHRQEFSVGNFEKPLILVDFLAGQGVDLGVGEGTEDQVHLTHAAMPGAEQKLAAARVQPLA